MIRIYLVLLTSVVLLYLVPSFIKKLIYRKTQSHWLAFLAAATVVGAIVVFSLMQLDSLLFYAIVPNYPVEEKIINENYYFTQQEYGWAASGMPGKHLEFYENRNFWSDRKVGHIQWRQGIAEIEAKFDIVENGTMWRLILFQNNTVQLDTLLDRQTVFDFVYKPWQD